MTEPTKPTTADPASQPGVTRWSVDSERSRGRLPVAVSIGFAVGGLAFLIGSVLLVTTSKGAGTTGTDDDLRAEIASLREALSAGAKDVTTPSAQVGELRAQLEKLAQQLEDLERTLTAGDPGRIAKLEKALRESEEATRAGEEALLAKGMRGPLMVFKDAARRVRGGDGPPLKGIGPGARPGPRPQRPAEPEKIDRDF